MKYLDLAIANEQIKTTDIKGKEYAEVNQRIKVFRMLYPDGFIRTTLISNEDGVCVMKAEVGANDYVLATGTAYEKEDSSFINKTSYIENCETSAVGRALGMLGIGIETSVASAEEVQNAINNQTITQEDADNYTLKFGKYKGLTLKEIAKQDEKYINWIIQNTQDENLLEIIRLATGIYIPSLKEQEEKTKLLVEISKLDIDREDIHDKYNVENITDLSIEQLKEIINGNK
jgi:hypothetical protein